MKYKVKLSYPSLINVNGKDYILHKDAILDLPESDIIKTYEGLGYIEKVKEEIEIKKTEEVKANAS